MVKVIWSDEALADLVSIRDYLNATNPASTIRVCQGIYDHAQIIKDHPEIGWRDPDFNDQEIRNLIHGHYRIIYQPRELDSLEILAIWDTRRDVGRLNM